jgi:hypothetical protein
MTISPKIGLSFLESPESGWSYERASDHTLPICLRAWRFEERTPPPGTGQAPAHARWRAPRRRLSEHCLQGWHRTQRQSRVSPSASLCASERCPTTLLSTPLENTPVLSLMQAPEARIRRSTSQATLAGRTHHAGSAGQVWPERPRAEARARAHCLPRAAE